MNDTMENKQKLNRMNLTVTKYCNLHCRMCDFQKIHFMLPVHNLKKIQSIIKEGTELGMEFLDLTGGEPMTRKDIYEIISYGSSLGLTVSMTSNGVLVGEPEVEKLINAGLNAITFSLEGPESLNDQIRGKGNYKKTLNAIQCALAHTSDNPYFRVGVGITLSKYNYKVIVEFSKFLLEEIGVHNVCINPYNKVMLLPKNQKSRENEFIITPDEMDDLREEINKLIEYSKKNPDKLPFAAFLRKIPDYFEGKKMLPPDGCSIPLSFCGITVDGRVFLCWHMPHIGSLKKSTLKELLHSNKQKEFTKLALEGKCNGCLSSCYAEVHEKA